MNYDEMSDLEINMAVAKLEGFRIPKSWSDKRYYKEEENRLVCIAGGYRHVPVFPDFCNSWDDMGPIIEREKISIIFEREEHASGEWYSFFCDYFSQGDISFGHYESNKNPLRAAAITYLRNKGQ